jgi:hypothetical protein
VPEADGVHDELDRDAFDSVEFSDDELAQLALDADPFDPFDPELEPFGGKDATEFPVLPAWYMPAPGIVRSRPRAAVMFGFAVALVVINIGGFCVTWGFPEFVWK